MGQILPQPIGVEPHFVHADEADGTEMVLEGPQIPFGIRIQPCIQQLSDHRPFGLQAPGGNVHHVVQPVIEIRLVLGQIGDPGHVDGDHPYRTGGFPGPDLRRSSRRSSRSRQHMLLTSLGFISELI